MTDFEVGFVNGNGVVIAWKAVKTIVRTWWFARQNGLRHDKWYGVYHRGTEIKVAEFGCLPEAENNARLFVQALYGSPDSCSDQTSKG